MKIAETAASFLVLYKFRHNSFFCCNWTRLFSKYFWDSYCGPFFWPSLYLTAWLWLFFWERWVDFKVFSFSQKSFLATFIFSIFVAKSIRELGLLYSLSLRQSLMWASFSYFRVAYAILWRWLLRAVFPRSNICLVSKSYVFKIFFGLYWLLWLILPRAITLSYPPQSIIELMSSVRHKKSA